MSLSDEQLKTLYFGECGLSDQQEAAQEIEQLRAEIRHLSSPPAPAKDGMSEMMEKIRMNLAYLENLIETHGHESVLLREHPYPCNQHDFCFMKQAQKGANAIHEIIAAYEGKEEGQ